MATFHLDRNCIYTVDGAPVPDAFERDRPFALCGAKHGGVPVTVIVDPASLQTDGLSVTDFCNGHLLLSLSPPSLPDPYAKPLQCECAGSKRHLVTLRRAENAGLIAGTLGQRDPALDHGVLIPLSYLRRAGLTCPIVRLGLSGFSPLDHYRLGVCIARAAGALGRRAVFVASGDLSHKLKADGPYGFAPQGPAFDEAVTAAMASGDFLSFLTMDPALCERAAECGLRSFQIMAGALDGLAVAPRLLSHEGTFGVGYAVALFPVTGRDGSRRYEAAYRQARRAALAKRRAEEDPWVKLARLSLETYVNTGKRLDRLPEGLPEELTGRRAGAFVSLHLNGQLRGCIGTISPTAGSVAEEIVGNAVSAGVRDPRFPAVRPEELEELEYSVDVLGQPEPVASAAQLDPARYGVIVTCGGRRGLLLPDLDGVDTVEEQVRIACRKGGIRGDDPYTLERFQVVRHR